MTKNKIIGYVYVLWHGEYFAADLYEGNMVRYPDGNIESVDEEIYQKNLKKYQMAVEQGEKIMTACEANQVLGHEFYFKIPASTADPEAAEKEWFLRTHPQEQTEPLAEQPQRKRKLFGIRNTSKKRNCPVCGAKIKPGQKFCSECGGSVAIQQTPNESGEMADPDVMEPVVTDIESVDKNILIPHTNQDKETIPEKPVKIAKEVPGELPKKQKNKETLEEGKYQEPHKEPSPKRKEDEPKKKRKLRKGMIGGFFLFLVSVGVIGFVISHTLLADLQQKTMETVSTDNGTFIGIMFSSDLSSGSVIKKEDLDGCILSSSQYASYSEISTFIDEDGTERLPKLISWEDVDEVIGKRVVSDVQKGALVYDTIITSQHVIANRTYVDATINGEDQTIEVEDGTLPGNTKIQIVAVVSTDGADPVQILLSEMTLKDRSLESIFDSAGQDILDRLAGGASDGTDMAEEESDGSESDTEDEGE